MKGEIGYIEYMATGEGFTRFIFINHTKDEILNLVGEYFFMGLNVYDLEKVYSSKEGDDIYFKLKEIIKEHMPIVYKDLKRPVHLKTSYIHHINAS